MIPTPKTVTKITTPDITISALQVGRWLSDSSSDTQAEILTEFALAISTWHPHQSWDMQCAYIRDELKNDHVRDDIRSRLEVLVEALR